MNPERSLGEFEQIVLLAVLRLGDQAYGVTILGEIAAKTGRNPSPGALYTTLHRMEDKGLITFRDGSPTPERGGRAKRFVVITREGRTAIAGAQSAYRSLLEGLDLLPSPTRRVPSLLSSRSGAEGSASLSHCHPGQSPEPPMPKPPATEWLLARLTDPTRAAAILGDLVELAATRGRLWFWTTYARTLISLGWRTPLAFVAGCASLAALYQLWGFYSHHTPFAWRAWALPYIHEPVIYLALQLWFLVPFAVVRYGFEDRLVRVGLPVLLMATGAILSVPLLSALLAAGSIAAIAASLAYTGSRRSAITLVATVAVGAFTLLNLLFLAHMACWIDEHKPLNASSHYRFFETGFAFSHNLFWMVVWAIALLNMLVLTFACSRMHRRLMEPQLSGAAHA
jgi:DNA-binding PadR family transcriptional regulator